jgi:hypothetical protein
MEKNLTDKRQNLGYPLFSIIHPVFHIHLLSDVGKSEAEVPSDYPTPLVQLKNMIAAYTYLPTHLITYLPTYSLEHSP